MVLIIAVDSLCVHLGLRRRQETGASLALWKCNGNKGGTRKLLFYGSCKANAYEYLAL